MLESPFDPRQHASEIQRWAPSERPFVRIDTPDSGVHHGRAGEWCDSWIGVYVNGPSVFDGQTYWLPREWVTREPGWLPEYTSYRDSWVAPSVLWEPSACPWPREPRGGIVAVDPPQTPIFDSYSP